MNTNSNTMVMNDANQAQIASTFTKKILAHLDDPDPNKMAQFVQLFNPNNCRIILNATPFAQAADFLTDVANPGGPNTARANRHRLPRHPRVWDVDMQCQLQSQVRRKRQRQDGTRRDSPRSAHQRQRKRKREPPKRHE